MSEIAAVSALRRLYESGASCEALNIMFEEIEPETATVLAILDNGKPENGIKLIVEVTIKAA